jgi:phosphoribosylanthranilate isomerase
MGWLRGITGAATVGVFRDGLLEDIVAVRNALTLDWIQLHGNEPNAFADVLGPQVIQRVDPARGRVWETVKALSGRCLPLLDPGAGSGATFDWNALPPPPEGARFGLAGGLAPSNVSAVVRRLRPVMVDVSSGVEVSPGIKDHELIRRFIESARSAAAAGAPPDPPTRSSRQVE